LFAIVYGSTLPDRDPPLEIADHVLMSSPDKPATAISAAELEELLLCRRELVGPPFPAGILDLDGEPDSAPEDPAIERTLQEPRGAELFRDSD
jgi:hypothetical protein